VESGARSRHKQQQQQLRGIASAPAGPGVPPFFLHCTQPGPWVAEGVVCGRGSEPSGPDRRLGRPKKERGQKAGATRKNQRRVARRCSSHPPPKGSAQGRPPRPRRHAAWRRIGNLVPMPVPGGARPIGGQAAAEGRRWRTSGTRNKQKKNERPAWGGRADPTGRVDGLRTAVSSLPEVTAGRLPRTCTRPRKRIHGRPRPRAPVPNSRKGRAASVRARGQFGAHPPASRAPPNISGRPRRRAGGASTPRRRPLPLWPFQHIPNLLPTLAYLVELVFHFRPPRDFDDRVENVGRLLADRYVVPGVGDVGGALGHGGRGGVE